MSLREYVPPPKKAVGYAALAFVVVVLTVGLGIHVAPASWVSAAKTHAMSLWAQIKAKFSKNA